MFVVARSCLIFDSRILVVFEPDNLLRFTGGFHAVLRVILKPFEGHNSTFFVFFINLKKRVKISFKETDNIFVNGRKEYVELS